MTPQIAFKIYWPLDVEKHKHRTKNHDNALFYRYAILWWLCTYFLPIYYRTLFLFADSLLHIKIASGFGQTYLLFSCFSKVIRKNPTAPSSWLIHFFRSGKNPHDSNHQRSSQLVTQNIRVKGSFQIIWIFLDFLDFLGLGASLVIASCILHVFGFLWFFSVFSGLCASLLTASCISK